MKAGYSWCGAYSDCGRDDLEAFFSCLLEVRLKISASLWITCLRQRNHSPAASFSVSLGCNPFSVVSSSSHWLWIIPASAAFLWSCLLCLPAPCQELVDTYLHRFRKRIKVEALSKNLWLLDIYMWMLYSFAYPENSWNGFFWANYWKPVKQEKYLIKIALFPPL